MQKNGGKIARDICAAMSQSEISKFQTHIAKQSIADVIEQRDTLLNALEKLASEPVRYNGKTIEIDCASHGAAMAIMKYARAAVALAKGE